MTENNRKRGPLYMFAGLAVAGLAGLGILSLNREPPQQQTAAVGQAPGEAPKPAEPAGPAAETAASSGQQTAAVQPEAGSTPAAQKPAEGSSPETPAAQPDANAAPAAEKPAAAAQPSAAPQPVKPSFDTVRVEKSGEAVIAGKAAPGAEVTLRLNDEVIGKATANDDGDYVIIPEKALPAGTGSLSLEAQSEPGGPTISSEETVAVAVPEKPQGQTMVAVVKPDAPTEVIQNSSASAPAAPQPEAAAAVPQAEQQAAQPEQQAAAPAEQQAAQPEQQAAAPAEQPAVQPEQQASAQPEQQAATPAEQPTPQPEQQAAAPPAPPVAPVSLDAVDYDDKGNMVFSGRSKANAFVRIYVDNKPVGEAAVGSDNRWVFSGGPQIAPGEHTFRVDEIDAGGKVTSRIELPFFREAPAKVAELAQAEAPPPQPAETGAAAQAANTPPQPAPEQPVAAPEQAAGTPGAPPQPAPEQPVAAPEQAAGTPAAPQEPATAVSPQPAPQQPVAAPEQTAGTPAAPQEPATAVSPQPAPEQPVAAQPEGQEQQAAAPQPEPKAEPVPRPKSGRIIIQPGNNLWKLSRVIYGKGTQYTVIYEANRDLIRDADLIYPGQIFRTPNVVPPEKISPRRKTPLVPGETAQ